MDPFESTETITNWPLRDEPGVSLLLLGVLACVAAAAARSYGSLLLGGGMFLALAVCTWRMWLPTAVRFDTFGVRLQTCSGWRQLAWRDIRCCQQRRRGLLLLADREPSPVSAARGMYLRYGRRREQLRRAVERRCPELLGIVDETDFVIGSPEAVAAESTQAPAGPAG